MLLVWKDYFKTAQLFSSPKGSTKLPWLVAIRRHNASPTPLTEWEWWSCSRWKIPQSVVEMLAVKLREVFQN